MYNFDCLEIQLLHSCLHQRNQDLLQKFCGLSILLQILVWTPWPLVDWWVQQIQKGSWWVVLNNGVLLIFQNCKILQVQTSKLNILVCWHCT
jgi:hypothetical protein